MTPADATQRTDEATPTRGRRVSTRALVLGGILVSLVLAGIVSFYASASPDGLESVAEKNGFDMSCTIRPIFSIFFASSAAAGWTANMEPRTRADAVIASRIWVLNCMDSSFFDHPP